MRGFAHALWAWVAAAGTRCWLSEHAQVRKPIPGHGLRFCLNFLFSFGCLQKLKKMLFPPVQRLAPHFGRQRKKGVRT